MNSVKPLYGQGTFVVCENGYITQEVIFDYIDEELYYWNLLGDEDKLDEELNRIANNMQSFIDEEIIKINNKRIYPKVYWVDLGFRGSWSRPYIVFYINFKGDLRRGVNIYENVYEPEYVEYDYTVTWIFTGNLKVLKAYLGVEYDILADGRILTFSMHKGFNTPGYEKIEFKL